MKSYASYYLQVARLGLPILVGQVGVVVVAFADNIMVGRYSTEALASASFVNNVFNVINFCTMGFTYGILPLAGALHGAGDKDRGEMARRTGVLMRNAVGVNVAFALLLTALMLILYLNLHRLGQPEELLPLIRPYYALSAAGLLATSLFNAWAQWSYSIKNTSMPMWIMLGANALNIAGNYALIYGHWGCPELGLTGAGISTLVARWLGPVAIIGIFFCRKRYAAYSRGFVQGKIAWEQIKRVWNTSLPVSMQMAFESGSFSVAAVMAGWLGTIALASYQIIVIVGTLGFCLYYAIGSAVAVLVSNEAGAGSRADMRRAGWAGYHVMLVLASCSTLAFIFFARPLAHLFTTDQAVLSLTMTLLFPLVLYQLGDATQVTFANALRGTSHVMPMLWIAFASYIVVGIPATYLFAFTAGLGLYGIVLSFSVSLFMAGALFLYFFLKYTKSQLLIK